MAIRVVTRAALASLVLSLSLGHSAFHDGHSAYGPVKPHDGHKGGLVSGWAGPKAPAEANISVTRDYRHEMREFVQGISAGSLISSITHMRRRAQGQARAPWASPS